MSRLYRYEYTVALVEYVRDTGRNWTRMKFTDLGPGEFIGTAAEWRRFRYADRSLLVKKLRVQEYRGEEEK